MTDAIHSRDIPGPATCDSAHQLAAIARHMIDDGSYMTLATADHVFDSRAPIGTGQAVYLEAVAGEVTGDDAVRGIEVFSARSQAQGGHAWSLADIQSPARLRLYRAIASEVFVLNGRDQRIAVAMTE
jgi:hypothetical protein